MKQIIMPDKVIETSSIQPDKRFKIWREKVYEEYGLMSCEPKDLASFRGALATKTHEKFMLSEVDCSRQVIRRDSVHLSKPGLKDNFKIIVLMTGCVTYSRPGNNYLAFPGDVIIINSQEEFCLDFHDDYHAIVIQLERSDFSFCDIGSAGVYFIKGQQGAGCILSQYLVSFSRELNQLNKELVEMSLRHLLFLIRFARKNFELESPFIDFSNDEPLLIMAKSYIQKNLKLPLTASMVAKQLHISTRKLQYAFERNNSTVSNYIKDARLERSKSIILHAKGLNMGIGLISHNVGFNSQQHFSREFKIKYGVTPTEFSNMAIQGVSTIV